MKQAFRQLVISSLFLAGSANAALETWHLEGTFYQNSNNGSFTIPAEFNLGNSFSVDYVIDTEASSDGWLILNAVKNIAINGLSSEASGYISERGLGLNVTPSNPIWGLDFVSFNAFNLTSRPYPSYTTTRDLLALYALSPLTNSGDIRFDFANSNYTSVWGHVDRFAVAAVPEPASYLLALGGLLSLTIGRRFKRQS